MQTIYTVGHSTHPLQEFSSILHAFSIQTVVDIRTIPRSRKNPQYNQEELESWLKTSGVGYVHLRDLGGLRHPRKDSVNIGWKNESFRGYADYMQSDQFASAISQLISFALEQTVTVMCAEAVPWRCHRSLVGDALLVRGVHVQHIMSATSSKAHVLTAWARVDGLRITYPAETSNSLSPDRL